MLALGTEEREPGWQEWLQQYQLADPQLSEQDAYIRYKKFKGLEFGPVVHEDDRHLYYRDLLPLEASLVCGDAIGCVKDYPFVFEVLDDRPIRQSFIKYPPTETK